MERLLETFCLLDGEVLNCSYHQDRVVRSLGIQYSIAPMLDAIVREAHLLGAANGKWRATVTYTAERVEGVRLMRYQIPNITGLKLISIHENFYQKKWANRERFEEYKSLLLTGVEPIFVLDNQITDTAFTNIIVEQEGTFYTPAHPLLRGTKRSKLLCENKVVPAQINADELCHFERIHLINAMLDLGDLTLPIDAIL